MLANLKCNVSLCINDLIRFIKKNRYFYIAFAVCAIIGIIIAVADDPNDEESKANFIGLMLKGDFSPLGYIFKIVGICALCYAAVLCAGLHFYMFIGAYVGVIAGSAAYFACVFNALRDGVSGWIFMLCYALPVFVFNAFVIIGTLVWIYYTKSYYYKKAKCLSCRCQFAEVAKYVAKRFLRGVLFSLTLWLIIYLITLLFV